MLCVGRGSSGGRGGGVFTCSGALAVTARAHWRRRRERSLVKDRARELLLLLLPMLLPVPVLRRAHGQAAAAADRG